VNSHGIHGFTFRYLVSIPLGVPPGNCVEHDARPFRILASMNVRFGCRCVLASFANNARCVRRQRHGQPIARSSRWRKIRRRVGELRNTPVGRGTSDGSQGQRRQSCRACGSTRFPDLSATAGHGKSFGRRQQRSAWFLVGSMDDRVCSLVNRRWSSVSG